MILYFSGTGNSKLAAEKLATLMKEKIHNLEQGAPPAWQEQEKLVLVAPLYFWTLPSLVLDYLAQHQQLIQHELHVVMTCGGALGAGASLITRQLRRLGFNKAHVHALVMTTNYIPLHQVQSPDAAAMAIQAALDRLPEIAEDIRRKRGAHTSSFWEWSLPVFQGMYDRARRTRHFYVTSRCIGCGLCERDCPSRAIGLLNGRPAWNKPRCALCLRCVHRCPTAAIEYGASTVGKERYHPEKFLPENPHIGSNQGGK
ncbi:MAG: EFR1 family ferrodoxin [Christensenellales bacterium]|jgi:ferredoxin